LPWALVGLDSVAKTDGVLSSIVRPTVAHTGQQALVTMLRNNGVKRVVTMDYEAAGALEIAAPDIQFDHGWARVVRDRNAALDELVSHAMGGHLLVIPHSPPWSYNLRPRAEDLELVAARAGASSVEVDRLSDGVVVLYAVGSRKGRP
jgi:hypothetical protein